jgi:outer membrane protein TolC
MTLRRCRWLGLASLAIFSLTFFLFPNHVRETLAQGKEEAAQQALSLRDAVAVGLQKNPRILAVKAQVEASDARVGQARSGLFPQVEVSESYSRTNNPMWAFGTKLNQERITSEDFDPQNLNHPKPIDNFSTVLSATLPIYDRGQTWHGLAQARLGHEAMTLLEARVGQEVNMEIVEAYMGAILARENLLVVEQTLETSRSHYASISSRYKTGLVVKSDLLRAEVRIAELEQERLNAESQFHILEARLNAAMGEAPGNRYALSTCLVCQEDLSESLDAYIQKALENRKDLENLRLQEQIAGKEVQKAKSAHLPGVYLSGNYEMDTEEFDDTANNYTIGASLRLNVFSGFGYQSRVHEAAANQRQAQAIIQQMELGIQVETRQAYFQAKSARDRIGVAKASVTQAEEGLRIVRNRYENGMLTIVNLLDAEVALQLARMHQIKALHDFRVSMARLHLAAGVLDPASP